MKTFTIILLLTATAAAAPVRMKTTGVMHGPGVGGVYLSMKPLAGTGGSDVFIRTPLPFEMDISLQHTSVEIHRAVGTFQGTVPLMKPSSVGGSVLDAENLYAEVEARVEIPPDTYTLNVGGSPGLVYYQSGLLDEVRVEYSGTLHIHDTAIPFADSGVIGLAGRTYRGKMRFDFESRSTFQSYPAGALVDFGGGLPQGDDSHFFPNTSLAPHYNIFSVAAGPGQGIVFASFASLGDFNYNGLVDAPDYNVWRDTFGSTELLDADGNHDGVIGAADYNVWRDHYVTQPVGAVVPEPSALIALLAAAACLTMRRVR